MQLCNLCIQTIKLVISQPQMLKIFDGCDNCRDIKKRSVTRELIRSNK
jgi:hypothetical protein